MFDHLLESSLWDDSSKWSNIEFGQEIDILKMKIRTLSGALFNDLKPYFNQSIFNEDSLILTLSNNSVC